MIEEIEAEGTYEILFRKIGEKYYIVGISKNDNIMEKMLNLSDVCDDEFLSWLTEYQYDGFEFEDEYVLIKGKYQLIKNINKNGYSMEEKIKFQNFKIPTKEEIKEIMNL